MTDLRALIHRMADELDHYRQLLTDNRRELHSLATEARAALAKPEPEGPTYEELCDLGYEFTISTGHGSRLDEIGFARAVLARWGNRSAPQPVPVSEPPRPEDCDAEGQCWWLIEPYPRPVGPGGKLWSLCRYCPGTNYWLPVNALPLPDAEDNHDQ